MGSLLLALIYLCFISLGLPDSLLGSAWPILHEEISVPVSFAGIISMVICLGTIVSSFFSDRLLRRFGAGKVIAFSVATTAAALFGFSVSKSFWMLLIWSIPYGLGAGAIDAVLNNYVALHYKAQHMSWLHCMWGAGASVSPYIMSFALIKLDSWNYGYLIVAIIQTVLSVFIFTSLPLWKKQGPEDIRTDTTDKPMRLGEIFKVHGAISCFITFFAYCALELTTTLWASSYLVSKDVSPETAAGFASLVYIGITLGRAANGFLAMKLSDRVLIRAGLIISFAGIILILIPFGNAFAFVGFITVGLGCAPIYPCIIHMTPDVFGKDKSQAMIGMQMAFAYTGFLIMPSVFGFIANHVSIALLPWYMLALLILMAVTHEIVVYKTKRKSKQGKNEQYS